MAAPWTSAHTVLATQAECLLLATGTAPAQRKLAYSCLSPLSGFWMQTATESGTAVASIFAHSLSANPQIYPWLATGQRARTTSPSLDQPRKDGILI